MAIYRYDNFLNSVFTAVLFTALITCLFDLLNAKQVGLNLTLILSNCYDFYNFLNQTKTGQNLNEMYRNVETTVYIF